MLFSPNRPSSTNLVAWILVAFVSAGLTYWSVARRIQQRQIPAKVSQIDTLNIFMVAFAHFFLTFAQTIVWIWITPQRFDWVFMMIHAIRLVSYFWVECIFNYTEKRIINDAYVMNSDPYGEPYIEGLPWYMQIGYLVAVVVVAPYVMFVIFSTSPYFKPYSLYVAIAITMWSLYGWIKFASAKIFRLQPSSMFG